MKVKTRLIPPVGTVIGSTRSTKSFHNGVVACGSTFCDREKCHTKKYNGELVQVCDDSL
ncbi:hypothetical protein KIN20_000501 [Parelaphostrongylus tenuis]|uniref:Uncharacterized protein n=1 Tax=Parelaphostrongylus tenuis TaxID=148309 RepID=A0AAD5LUU3_PARTN|nr:hypothetical protein KIN20_000501 [Parelaphostrongylus tenuis]